MLAKPLFPALSISALLVDGGSERDREGDGLLFIVHQHCCPSRASTGGIIFAQSGYLAVFAMAFGLICLDIVLRLALVEKEVAAKWSSALNEEEGYWISNYDNEGPPSIAPSSKMKSLLPFGSLEIMETYDSTASIINRQAVSIAWTTSRLIHNLSPVITLLRSRRLLAALWGSLV